jgi:hypothetical protein
MGTAADTQGTPDVRVMVRCEGLLHTHCGSTCVVVPVMLGTDEQGTPVGRISDAGISLNRISARRISPARHSRPVRASGGVSVGSSCDGSIGECRCPCGMVRCCAIGLQCCCGAEQGTPEPYENDKRALGDTSPSSGAENRDMTHAQELGNSYQGFDSCHLGLCKGGA